MDLKRGVETGAQDCKRGTEDLARPSSNLLASSKLLAASLEVAVELVGLLC